jgi:DNA-3-methyladenine glycosylase II
MTVLAVPVRAPFDFAQTRAFVASFPPCRGDVIADGDALIGAHAVGGGAIAWRLSAPATGVPTALRLELAGAPSAPDAAEVARLVGAYVSADDDLADFYACAAGDHPAYRAIVARFHGLHHVRFPSLAEVTCYAILAQRTPMTVAAALKRRLVAAYGHVAHFGDHAVPAFPTLATLREVPEADLSALLKHPEKARRMHGAIAAVSALGEPFLRTGRYADVAAALRQIHGIGPFSAAMILLRGLGRMDAMDPRQAPFDAIGGAIYGAAWDPVAIERRYGPTIGLWSYYLRVGEPAGLRAPRTSTPPRLTGTRTRARPVRSGLAGSSCS